MANLRPAKFSVAKGSGGVMGRMQQINSKMTVSSSTRGSSVQAPSVSPLFSPLNEIPMLKNGHMSGFMGGGCFVYS